MNRFFVLPAFLSLAIQFQANAVGFTVRGGGDEVGLEFQSVFNVAMSIVENNNDLNKYFDFKKLQNLSVELAVVEQELVVEVSPGIFQNSVAANYPTIKLIEINRAKWSGLSEIALKQGLALHEMLSLIGVEKTGTYPISSKYVAKFGVSNSKFLASLGWATSAPILEQYELSSISVVCSTQNCNTGHTFPNDYQVSPDGTRILESRFLKAGLAHWKLFTIAGRQLLEFVGYSVPYWEVFLKNGLFLGTTNGVLGTYDRNGVLVTTLVGTDVNDIKWTRLSPSKDRLIVASKDSWQLWGLESAQVTLLYSSKIKLMGVTFDTNTENFISSEANEGITLRDGSGATLKKLGKVYDLGFAPKGGSSFYQDLSTNQMTVLGVDGAVVSAPITGVTFIKQLLFPLLPGADNSWMTIDSKGQLKKWSKDGQLLQSYPNLDLYNAELSTDGLMLVSDSHKLEIVNTETGQSFPLKLPAEDSLKRQYSIQKFVFNDLVLTAHNFSGQSSAIYAWDTSGKLIRTFFEGSGFDSGSVKILKVDAINRRILVKIGNNQLAIWSLDLDKQIFSFDIKMRQLVSVEFTGRGLMLVTSDISNKVQIERWEPLP